MKANPFDVLPTTWVTLLIELELIYLLSVFSFSMIFSTTLLRRINYPCVNKTDRVLHIITDVSLVT